MKILTNLITNIANYFGYEVLLIKVKPKDTIVDGNLELTKYFDLSSYLISKSIRNRVKIR